MVLVRYSKYVLDHTFSLMQEAQRSGSGSPDYVSHQKDPNIAHTKHIPPNQAYQDHLHSYQSD